MGAVAGAGGLDAGLVERGYAAALARKACRLAGEAAA